MLHRMNVPPATMNLSAPSGGPQHVNMKQSPRRLSQRSAATLRTRLQSGGRTALTQGLATPALARMHELLQESWRNLRGLKNEIANPRRWVATSVKSVRVVATRLGSS